jgi:hypothetical protein
MDFADLKYFNRMLSLFISKNTQSFHSRVVAVEELINKEIKYNPYENTG